MSWHFTRLVLPSEPITALNRKQVSARIKPKKADKRRPTQLELPLTPAGHAAYWQIPYRDQTR